MLQRTQNQDTKAVNIKLDELLRAIEGARTGFVNLSTLTDEELDKREAELLTGVGGVGRCRHIDHQLDENRRGTASTASDSSLPVRPS